MNTEEFIQIVKESKSKSEVCKKLGYATGGGGMRKVKKMIEDLEVDISHFERGSTGRAKYPVVEKTCPVCGTKFKTKLGSSGEKTTCSHSCSNSYYRSGVNNPNWKDDAYRSTCFHYHKKECVICGEDKIIDVHHYDENRKNNLPENLIPLCPTHHMYMHSRYKDLVSDKVDEYRQEFIKRHNNG